MPIIRGKKRVRIEIAIEHDLLPILDYLGELSDASCIRTLAERREHVGTIALQAFFEKAAEELPRVRKALKEARTFQSMQVGERQRMLQRAEKYAAKRRGEIVLTDEFPIPVPHNQRHPVKGDDKDILYKPHYGNSRGNQIARDALAKVGAGETSRPPTPTGWSDTDWIKHLQEQQHPMSGLHINQGSMDAAADAYEAEYNARHNA